MERSNLKFKPSDHRDGNLDFNQISARVPVDGCSVPEFAVGPGLSMLPGTLSSQLARILLRGPKIDAGDDQVRNPVLLSGNCRPKFGRRTFGIAIRGG